MCDAFQVSASRTDIEDAEYIAMENLQAQHQKEEGLFDMVSTSNIVWSSRLYFICENVLLVSGFTIYSTHTQQLLGLIQALFFICLFLLLLCQDEDISAKPSTLAVTSHPVAERLDNLMAVLMGYVKDICHVNGK